MGLTVELFVSRAEGDTERAMVELLVQATLWLCEEENDDVNVNFDKVWTALCEGECSLRVVDTVARESVKTTDFDLDDESVLVVLSDMLTVGDADSVCVKVDVGVRVSTGVGLNELVDVSEVVFEEVGSLLSLTDSEEV